MMALVRASARTRGKSDPIDALAVARAYLREPSLPVACHDEVSRELKLLVDRRETWSPSGPRPSTACCGGSTSSIRGRLRGRGRWTWPSTSRRCGSGWSLSLGWWLSWRSMNWMMSSP